MNARIYQNGSWVADFAVGARDLLARINEIFEENDLPILDAASRMGASDAADVTFAGAACIDSLGVRGGKIHTPDEFAYIESLAEAAKRLVAVAANI